MSNDTQAPSNNAYWLYARAHYRGEVTAELRFGATAHIPTEALVRTTDTHHLLDCGYAQAFAAAKAPTK